MFANQHLKVVVFRFTLTQVQDARFHCENQCDSGVWSHRQARDNDRQYAIDEHRFRQLFAERLNWPMVCDSKIFLKLIGRMGD